MAISLKTSGAWVEAVADATPTLVGTPAAGDRYFIFATWKDFSITTTVDAASGNWVEVTEFAEGAVASGVGTGSMKVGCWYRDWQSGDNNPTINFSGTPQAAYCMQLWQKGAGENWDTPSFATAAHASSAGPVTRSASATVTVPDGSVVFALWGISDDSATFTRPTTGIDVASGITWNGNYVESPATHGSFTTGNDCAADLGHRFVTTGAAGATLRASITALAAAETGAILWVVQGVLPVGGGTWTNLNSGTADRNGTVTHTIGHSTAATAPSTGSALDFVPTASRLLVVVVSAAVTNTSSGTGNGSGWTKHQAPVNSGETAMFSKTAVGNDFLTLTHNGSNYPINWAVYEFAAGSTYLGSTSATASNTTFPALSSLPSFQKFVIAALGVVCPAATPTGGSTVSSPWTEDVDIIIGDPSATTDGTYLYAFSDDNVTATSVTPAITYSVVGSQSADKQKIVAAFNVVVSSGAGPTLKVIRKQLSVAIQRAGFH